MSQVSTSQPMPHPTRTRSTPQAAGMIQESQVPRDSSSDTSGGTGAEEQNLIERLRNGDEAAFTSLVDRYHGAMIRVALAHVSDRSLTEEGVTFLEQAIEGLPARLRQVLVMRDVEGVSSREVCSLLEISEANQRVLLHRSRSKVRRALERYLEEGMRPA